MRGFRRLLDAAGIRPARRGGGGRHGDAASARARKPRSSRSRSSCATDPPRKLVPGSTGWRVTETFFAIFPGGRFEPTDSRAGRGVLNNGPVHPDRRARLSIHRPGPPNTRVPRATAGPGRLRALRTAVARAGRPGASAGSSPATVLLEPNCGGQRSVAVGFARGSAAPRARVRYPPPRGHARSAAARSVSAHAAAADRGRAPPGPWRR
jgi:hypothetical protein